MQHQAGAAFVKTSTGFSTGGATVEAVRLMRAVTHDTRVKVKASGGIGSLADVRCMVEAGAERIGASRTAQILKDADHGADAGASATRDGY
jgi:deoxyribose-phosphate aldolase